MALRELLAVFDVDTGKASEHLHGLNHQISEGIESFKAFGEALAGAFMFEALKGFVEQQIEAGAQLKITSEKLGVTTDELQQFQLAAQLSGTSAEDAANGLRFLNKNIGEALTGGKEASETFKKMGVDLKNQDGSSRSVIDVTADLSDAFEGLESQGERTAYAMKLFGRGGVALLPMLQEGGEKVEKLFEQFELLGGGISEQFTEKAHEAEQDTVKLGFAMKGLKSTIAIELLPGFRAGTQKLTDWAIGAIKLAKETNIVKVAMIAMGAFGAMKAVGPLLSLARTLGLVKEGFGGTVAGLLKFGATALLLAGIVLIFEDLYTMIQGGDSAIGDFIEETEGLGAKQEFITELKDAWASLKSVIDDTGFSVTSFVKEGLLGIINAIPYIIRGGELMAQVFGLVANVLMGIVDMIAEIPNAIKNLDFGFITRQADIHADVQKGILGDISQTWGQLMNTGSKREAQTFERGSGPVVPASQVGAPSGPGIVAVNQKNETNITVQGADNPRDTARMVGKELRDVQANDMRNAYGAVWSGAPDQ